MDYSQNESNKLDSFISIVAPWIVIGFFGLSVFGFYKLCTGNDLKNNNKKTEQVVKPITAKDIFEHNNVKTL